MQLHEIQHLLYFFLVVQHTHHFPRKLQDPDSEDEELLYNLTKKSKLYRLNI